MLVQMKRIPAVLFMGALSIQAECPLCVVVYVYVRLDVFMCQCWYKKYATVYACLEVGQGDHLHNLASSVTVSLFEKAPSVNNADQCVPNADPQD